MYSLKNVNLEFKKHLKQSAIMITFIITATISISSFAEDEEGITSTSYSVAKDQVITQNNKDAFDQVELPALAEQAREKAVNKERSATKVNNNNMSDTISANINHQFSIFSANASLIDDFDSDGYFRSFAVTFDADVLNYHDELHTFSLVYAKLYLSKNGGPWLHYYTTDDFIIDGDSTNDEHEVITTLHTGYQNNEYDVLIDLYEVGFEDIVATISADDIEELHALPLESANNDIIYVDHHGGSVSFLGLLIILLFIFKQKIQSTTKLDFIKLV